MFELNFTSKWQNAISYINSELSRRIEYYFIVLWNFVERTFFKSFKN